MKDVVKLSYFKTKKLPNSMIKMKATANLIRTLIGEMLLTSEN